MQMQEPEQQQSRQQQEQQPEFVEVVVGEEPYQEQKIHPQGEMRSQLGAMPIAGIVFSALGFCVSIGGILLAAIILKYSPGSESKVSGGLAIAGSVLLLLGCITVFIVSIIVLAVRYNRVRGRRWRSTGRYMGSRYR